MARLFTAFFATIALAATTITPLSSAYARDRSVRPYYANQWNGTRYTGNRRYYQAGNRYYGNRRYANKGYHGNNRYYRGYRPYYRGPYYGGYYNGDALLFGFLGLATGAIIAGSVYNQPGYYPAGDIQPWTDPWFRYCANKYRSFNAATGTYRGYDGYDHFCVVP